MLLKIRLLNTHGDLHYVGLSGLEIYDENLEPILGKTGSRAGQVYSKNTMGSPKNALYNPPNANAQ
jgi:hypothetical protein